MSHYPCHLCGSCLYCSDCSCPCRTCDECDSCEKCWCLCGIDDRFDAETCTRIRESTARRRESSSTPTAPAVASSPLRIVNEYCRDTAGMKELFSQVGEHTECALCFDPLCARQCVLLMQDDLRRTCRHIFHEDCIHDLCSTFTQSDSFLCPLCRLSYSAGKLLPNPLQHPLEYFQALDHNNSGDLNIQEVKDGLTATIPLDSQRIDKEVDNLFSVWDTTGSGTISVEEFSGSESRIMAYIRKYYPLPAGNIPNIREKPRDWFTHFDEDKDGTLDKGEVTRAVAKTVNLLDDTHVQDFINNVWAIFDDDDNGSIDIDEFTRSDGLGDMIIANLVDVMA